MTQAHKLKQLQQVVVDQVLVGMSMEMGSIEVVTLVVQRLALAFGFGCGLAEWNHFGFD